MGDERFVKVGKALAVLGRDRDRVAEAEPERLVGAGHPRHALGLVGKHDYRLSRTAGEFGEGLVGGQDAGARIDNEENEIGFRDRGFGLRPHAPEQRALVGFFEAGRVDDSEA
jgi:hypothetical protein